VHGDEGAPWQHVEPDSRAATSREFPQNSETFLVMQAASPGNKQFRILLIAKAIAIINRNHVLIRLPPPLRRMRFSEATR